MSNLTDPGVAALLDAPNHAVIATHNADGSILSNVVWVDAEDGAVAVNSAEGRRWPANLQRNPERSLLVMNQENPYEFVEIRGVAESTHEGADEHIDRLAKKYLGQDEYPFRQPGEQRVKFTVRPSHVRYVNQG
jgi:PPOX class probable F420-dependent enzyme